MVQKQKNNTTTSKPADIQSQASNLLCYSPVRANNTTDAGNCGDRGAQPSNTAPANCKNPEHPSTSVLHTGIDSLYVSYKGKLSKSIEQQLEHCKSFAQSTEPQNQSKASIKINEHHFQVRANGKGKFVFVIVDNWFHIQIARATAQSIPMVYAQISSELLTVSGVKNAIDNLNKTVSQIGIITREAQISRVDICTDFTTDIDFFLHLIMHGYPDH